MKRWIGSLGFVFTAGVTLGASVPRVVLLSDAINEPVRHALLEKAGGKLQIVDSKDGDTLDSAQASASIEALKPKAADVLLLGFGQRDLRSGVSLEQFLANLQAIAQMAGERSLPIIWCGFGVDGGGGEPAQVQLWQEAAGKLMQENGAVIADFPGFLKSLALNGPEKKLPPQKRLDVMKGDFFAEALGQWWSVLAPSNPDVTRVRLWADQAPPDFIDPGPTRLNNRGRVDRVSLPELTQFTPKAKGGGTAVIVFPGGGYAFLGFLRNARELSEILAPHGVVVFGLSYRTGRGAAVPLHDAKRAVQWVRSRAAEFGVDPNRIGIAGTSAGAHLALSLATQWQPGKPNAVDPLDRVSSRPDFVAVFSVWNFGSTESPFRFQADTPPVFLRHARGDKGFALGERVVQQLQDASVPVNYLFLDQGGHGAFDFEPGSPGTDWPTDFLSWLRERHLWQSQP